MIIPTVHHPRVGETAQPNFYEIITGDGTFYISYQTCIAYRLSKPCSGLVIRQNDWGPTTGRHLNYINDDKSIRVTSEEFERALEAL